MDNIKEIIENIIYCNISTVCDDGTPWGSPVYFGYDDELNIYWRSDTESVHSKNIAKRPEVYITIFDSQSKWGEGKGAYLKGIAKKVEQDKNIVMNSLQILDKRSGHVFKPEEFMGTNPRRVYKFTPTEIWTNVDSSRKGKFVDIREEVPLS